MLSSESTVPDAKGRARDAAYTKHPEEAEAQRQEADW